MAFSYRDIDIVREYTRRVCITSSTSPSERKNKKGAASAAAAAADLDASAH